MRWSKAGNAKAGPFVRIDQIGGPDIVRDEGQLVLHPGANVTTVTFHAVSRQGM